VIDTLADSVVVQVAPGAVRIELSVERGDRFQDPVTGDDAFVAHISAATAHRLALALRRAAEDAATLEREVAS